MDYVVQTTPSACNATPCQWSADDAYPASLLAGLRHQAEPSRPLHHLALDSALNYTHHYARHCAALEYDGV